MRCAFVLGVAIGLAACGGGGSHAHDVDAGSDDAPVDAAVDARRDPDAQPDAPDAPDAPNAHDAAPDASVDAAPDAVPDASPDAPPDAPPDAAPDAPPDAPGCGTLAALPADVFVDRSSTADSVGTVACPFHAIAEATALAPPDAGHPRTIHVVGATPAAVYTEAVIVHVPPHTTLAGDGEARITIAGGGPCSLAVGKCTVSLAGGGTLRGVTVTNASDFAIEAGGAGTAVVENVTASGAAKHGFLVRGDVSFDHATATGNHQDGVNAKSATVTVVDSDFVFNQGDGLHIDQNATLSLTGGRVDNNSGAGIRLNNGSSFTVLVHRVTGTSIQQNLLAGIDVAGNASLVLRGTTLFQNEMGVKFLHGPANRLDVGTAADPGHDVFSGALPVHQNVRAGVCIEQAPATPDQIVEGDTWRGCPPAARKAGPFCVSNNTYADLVFVPTVATSGSPFIAPAACTVGP